METSRVGANDSTPRRALNEPDISVENAQLTDSVNARNEQNAMFAKSAYKPRTKSS
jgi:hypothetical protein